MSDNLISRQHTIYTIDKYISGFDAIDANFLDGLKTAKKLIKELPSAQPEHTETHSCENKRTATHGWIPVTERLPKRKPDEFEYPAVAVTLEDGEVTVACYYESTKEWGCGEYYDQDCRPVAWLPLPEPYKGE